LTAADVAKHNTEKDCWLIIKNKVYDVTPFITSHPGGDAIFRLAGQDNTAGTWQDSQNTSQEKQFSAAPNAGFYGDQHPESVVEQVEEYYIGDLISDKKSD